MLDSVSIVLPCYNEQEAIPQVIPRLTKTLEDLKQSSKINSFEIIVVDDKSTDDSRELLLKHSHIKTISTEGKKRGYGKALKTGFKAASGEWIGFLDMDNTYRPEDIQNFVKVLIENKNEALMGLRPFNDKGMSFTRGLGNWVYVVLASTFYGSQLNDVCSGYRFFHRKWLNEVLSITEDGLDFSIKLTLMMISNIKSFDSIPIRYDERLGQSKLSVVADGWSFLKVLLISKIRSTSALKHSRVQ